MKANPTREHQWLQQLVGEWTVEMNVPTESGWPPEKSEGSERVRSLGDVWIVTEAQSAGPDGELVVSQMTLGFDPRKNRFVGTWVGSPIAFLWVYEGTLDPDGRVLTLEVEGPDMQAPGKTARYRDVIQLESPNHRVMTSQMLTADGTWQTFVTTQYRRKPTSA